MTGVTGRPETLVDVLTRRAEDDPAAVVATFLGGGSVTAGELLGGAERIARQLSSPRLGLAPQAQVLTCLRPGAALATVLAGVARAGCVEVPVSLDTPGGRQNAEGSPSAGSTQHAEGSRSTGGGPRAAVALLGTAALAANPALATLAEAVYTVDDGGGPGTLDDLRPGPLPRLPSPGDPALVLSTSGTTGRPKGVLLPHFAGVRHARRVSDSLQYGPDDVLYNAFPWNHVNIRHTGLLAALVSGARLLAVPRFSASAFWDVCRAEGVTAFNFMGAVAAILLRTGNDDGAHRVSRAYGGPAPGWLAGEFRSRFGVQLIEAYACTELGDVTSNRIGDVAAGTAGRPLPEYEVTLRDGNGRPVPQGEVGGITVRPRHRHISTLGYVGAPGDPPVWITTGDLGRFDEGGRLVFCGRHSDVIRRRGENISAWDVESVVASMPGIREAAAVGICSEFTEEDLLVAVVPAAEATPDRTPATSATQDRTPATSATQDRTPATGTTPGHTRPAEPTPNHTHPAEATPGHTHAARLTPEQVHAWCRDRLPRHAWPRYVTVLEALPRNGSAKVSKPALRDPAIVAAAADLEHLRRTASTGKDPQ